MDARVSPAGFPMIKVILRRLEIFEAESLQRCPFRVSDTTLDLPFPIRMPNAAWQRHCPIVPEHLAVQRVESGIVYVGSENAFAQIIEDNHASLCEGPDYAQKNTRRPYKRFCGLRDLLIIRA